MRLANLKFPLLAMAVAAGAAMASPAYATLIVTEAGGGGGDNLISAACDAEIVGPATTIEGCLNGDHSLVIRIEGNENIFFDAGGQAVIAASDGYLSYLKFSIPGYTFDEIIFNLDGFVDGTVSFANNLGDVSGLYDLGGSGENFFTLSGDDFEWVSFTAQATSYDSINGPGVNIVQVPQNVVDVKQVRLNAGDEIDPCPTGDCDPTEVPEPGTMALFGTALIGLAALRRRRKI